MNLRGERIIGFHLDFSIDTKEPSPCVCEIRGHRYDPRPLFLLSLLFYVSYLDIGFVFYDPVVIAAGGPIVNLDSADIAAAFASLKYGIFDGILPTAG